MERDNIKYDVHGENTEKELRALKSAMTTFLKSYDISISYPGEILVKNLTFKDVYNDGLPLKSVQIRSKFVPIHRIDSMKTLPEGYVKDIRHNSARIVIGELEYSVSLSE